MIADAVALIFLQVISVSEQEIPDCLPARGLGPGSGSISQDVWRVVSRQPAPGRPEPKGCVVRRRSLWCPKLKDSTVKEVEGRILPEEAGGWEEDGPSDPAATVCAPSAATRRPMKEGFPALRSSARNAVTI